MTPSFAILPYDRFPSTLPYPALYQNKFLIHSPQLESHSRRFLYSKQCNNNNSRSITSNFQRRSSESCSASFTGLKFLQRASSTPDVSLDVPFLVHTNKLSLSDENAKNCEIERRNESSKTKPLISGKRYRRKRIAPKVPSTQPVYISSGSIASDQPKDEEDANKTVVLSCDQKTNVVNFGPMKDDRKLNTYFPKETKTSDPQLEKKKL